MNANTLRRRVRDRGTHHEAAKEGHHTNKTVREAANAAAPRAEATWTTERVAQLRGCVSAGLTSSQIAVAIRFTRNAFIGYLNRLGLRRPIAMADAFIAATADAHGLALVTRNVSDFEASVKAIVNPWADG